MNKKFPVIYTVFAVLIAAVITFQITYISLGSRYDQSLKAIEAELSGSISGKLAELDSAFRSMYVGEVDEALLEEAVLGGYIIGTGDRYAEYITADRFSDLVSDLSGEFQGIGITVIENSEYECIEIISVMPDSPALAAGVEEGDLIYKIGDELVSELGFNTAVNKLQGKSGTKAEFTVRRGESYEKELTFSIERGYITEQTVMYRMLDDGSGTSDIGIITILSFDGKTPEQFEKAVSDLRASGAAALIFDVRYNPGGELDSIVNILDTLVPEGPIIRIASADGTETSKNSDATELNIPMAVLVNGSTASAAELFSAALQDYDKAALVGTTTYGKGCMQTITQLPSGGALRVTTNMYNPPFSENYDGIGVIPDLTVEPNETLLTENRYKIADKDDNQLMAAAELLREQIDTKTEN